MHIDDWFTLKITRKDLSFFLRKCKTHTQMWKGVENISNPEGKVYCAILIRWIRNVDAAFFGHLVKAELNIEIPMRVEEVVTLHRMCKIIQMETGEENEEQQIIQRIQQDLYKVI